MPRPDTDKIGKRDAAFEMDVEHYGTERGAVGAER